VALSELEIFRQQNFGNPIGFGRKPALLVVDFTVGFNDPALFGGGNIDPAVKRTVRLVGFFRERKLPVAYTRVVYADDGSDGGIFATKQPRLLILTESHPAGQIVPELAPRPGELVVRKNQASAFFGTHLAPWLVQQGADTVVIRAATSRLRARERVDAISYTARSSRATASATAPSRPTGEPLRHAAEVRGCWNGRNHRCASRVKV
jgi:maleamate amidohydrolase